MNEILMQIQDDIKTAFDYIDVDEAVVIVRKDGQFAVANVTDNSGKQSKILSAIAEMVADVLNEALKK